MSFFAPVRRAEITLYETYRPRLLTRLPERVTAFSGENHPTITREQVEAWRVSSTDFRLRFFPGGHLFLRDSEALVLAAIHQELMEEYIP